jgi:hypothetical protein
LDLGTAIVRRKVDGREVYRAIANTENDYFLLRELAKSAKIRDLNGSAIDGQHDVEETVRALANKATDFALKSRIEFALKRFKNSRRSLSE